MHRSSSRSQSNSTCAVARAPVAESRCTAADLGCGSHEELDVAWVRCSREASIEMPMCRNLLGQELFLDRILTAFVGTVHLGRAIQTRECVVQRLAGGAEPARNCRFRHTCSNVHLCRCHLLGGEPA